MLIKHTPKPLFQSTLDQIPKTTSSHTNTLPNPTPFSSPESQETQHFGKPLTKIHFLEAKSTK